MSKETAQKPQEQSIKDKDQMIEFVNNNEGSLVRMYFRTTPVQYVNYVTLNKKVHVKHIELGWITCIEPHSQYEVEMRNKKANGKGLRILKKPEYRSTGIELKLIPQEFVKLVTDELTIHEVEPLKMGAIIHLIYEFGYNEMGKATEIGKKLNYIFTKLYEKNKGKTDFSIRDFKTYFTNDNKVLKHFGMDNFVMVQIFRECEEQYNQIYEALKKKNQQQEFQNQLK